MWSSRRYGFVTDALRGGAGGTKPLLIVRDPTNSYTGARFERQEFSATLELGYWPPDMMVLDTDHDDLYIVRGNEYVQGGDDAFGPQQVMLLPYGVNQIPSKQAQRVASYA